MLEKCELIFIKKFLIYLKLFGMISALFKVFLIYQMLFLVKEVNASFPTLLAAKILHIPVLIHESDSAQVG